MKNKYNEYMPVQIYWKFHKTESFQIKNSDFFLLKT